MKKRKGIFAAFAMGVVASFLMSLMVVPGFAATVAKTITVYTGITLYYDGVKVNPKDAAGKTVEPLLYNGTTYLPVRAVSDLFGTDINWDGGTKSVYIGDMPGKKTYLGVDLKPYDSYEYYDPSTFTMDGKTYMNGFTINWGWRGRALFNLDGKYDTLEFDIGHASSPSNEKQLLIYLDGSLAKAITIGAEKLVTHVSIPLNGALQIKFDSGTDSTGHISSGRIGIANAELS